MAGMSEGQLGDAANAALLMFGVDGYPAAGASDDENDDAVEDAGRDIPEAGSGAEEAFFFVDGLEALLGGLPPELADVVEVKYLGSFTPTHEQCALSLGLRVRTFERWLAEAKALLKEM